MEDNEKMITAENANTQDTEQLENVENVSEQRAEEVEAPSDTTKKAAKVKDKLKNIIANKKFRIGAIAVIVILVIGSVLYYPTFKFNRVKNECVHIAGQAGTGKGYFSLDTLPDSYDNMDEDLKAILAGTAQENALEAIKYANKELGFDGVYSLMMKTTSLMGRQSEENDKYKVSWSYHPDNGLEVEYRIK